MAAVDLSANFFYMWVLRLLIGCLELLLEYINWEYLLLLFHYEPPYILYWDGPMNLFSCLSGKRLGEGSENKMQSRHRATIALLVKISSPSDLASQHSPATACGIQD